FIHGQDDGVWRRMEVQIHYVLQLLGEARIVAQLERLHTVRLQTVGPPDPSHRGEAHLADLRQRAGAPVGSRGRSLPSGQAEDLVDLWRQYRAGPPRARGIFLYTRDSLLDETLLPQSHRLAGDSQGLGNFLIGLVSGGHQQDLGTLHHPRSQSTAAREAIEVVLLFVTQP